MVKKIKQKLKNNVDMVRCVRRQKWGWMGNIARMRDDRWIHQPPSGNPYYTKENQDVKYAGGKM